MRKRNRNNDKVFPNFPYAKKFTQAEQDIIMARQQRLVEAFRDAVGIQGWVLGLPEDHLQLLMFHGALAGVVAGASVQVRLGNVAVIESVLSQGGTYTLTSTSPAGAEETQAPVRLAFSRIGAQVNGCGQWPYEDQKFWMKTENRSYYNFGCASQQNLAATTANPLDLLYPRGMTPADATRRMTVLGKYQEGKSPSGKYDGLDNVDLVQGLGTN